MRRVLALAVVAALLAVVACEQAAKPTVAIVFPSNGATIGFGGTIIKAVATDDKGVTKVEFFDNSATIGVDSTATADTFSVPWSGAAAGSHTLKAVVTNQDGATAEHSITVTVSADTLPAAASRWTTARCARTRRTASTARATATSTASLTIRSRPRANTRSG